MEAAAPGRLMSDLPHQVGDHHKPYVYGIFHRFYPVGLVYQFAYIEAHW